MASVHLFKRAIHKIEGPFRRRYGRTTAARQYTLELVTPGQMLRGQVAVVTGASGAIGRAIALHLAADGALVHLVGRDLLRLEQVSAEIATLGGESNIHVVDLLDDVAVTQFFTQLEQLNIVVCSAGGSARGSYAPSISQSMTVVDHILTTNLRGTISAVSAALGRMDPGGRIVCVGSIIGGRGKANMAEYAAAKAGLLGYVKSIAIELGPTGTTANVVSPGIVPRGTLDRETVERIKRTNVLGRIGTEEDIAAAVSFLASPRAGFITGTEVVVDGGRSLGLRGDK